MGYAGYIRRPRKSSEARIGGNIPRPGLLRAPEERNAGQGTVIAKAPLVGGYTGHMLLHRVGSAHKITVKVSDFNPITLPVKNVTTEDGSTTYETDPAKAPSATMTLTGKELTEGTFRTSDGHEFNASFAAEGASGFKVPGPGILRSLISGKSESGYGVFKKVGTSGASGSSPPFMQHLSGSGPVANWVRKRL